MKEKKGQILHHYRVASVMIDRKRSKQQTCLCYHHRENESVSSYGMASASVKDSAACEDDEIADRQSEAVTYCLIGTCW